MFDEHYQGNFIENGCLFRRLWIPPKFDENDNIIQEGRYRTIDITDSLPSYLCDHVELVEGTTIRDLFVLLEKHKDFLSLIQKRNHFLEYLEYGLKSGNARTPGKDRLSTEYVEIFYSIRRTLPETIKEDMHIEYQLHETGEKCKELVYAVGDVIEEETSITLEMRGMTPILTREQMEIEHLPFDEYDSSKNRIPLLYYGCDLPEIMDSRIVLSEKTYVDENLVSRNPGHENTVFGGTKNCYSLIQVIDIIFSTISWCGNVEESKKERDVLVDDRLMTECQMTQVLTNIATNQ